MTVKKKPGPKPEHPKDTVVRFRADCITLDKLKKITEKQNRTMSDVMREGIDRIYDEVFKK